MPRSVFLAGALGLAVAFAPDAGRAAQLTDVQHIIVIYLENRSFDNLFGLFPGADGLAAAGATKIQVDKDSHPFDFLPPVIDTDDKTPHVDPRFPAHLPNQPFSIEAYVPIGDKTGDLVHHFYEEQLQIDGGRMDKFVAYSDASTLVMGYYDASHTRLWEYAQKYTLADHFFHGAFGGSFLNHFWMICACTPRFENAPESVVARLNARGEVIPYRGQGDSVTTDGYAVNTLQPFGVPHVEKRDEPPLQLQTIPTIGDKLTSWAWYAGGWNDALKGNPKSFKTHHQPFTYFKNFGPDTDGRKQHLKDADDFLPDIAAGTLPQVAFYKPIGDLNEHPGYASVLDGDAELGKILDTITGNTKFFEHTIVLVTFDENGGFWDHVPPPVIDRWGPGVRVPTVIISPYAKKGFIDHTTYDTTSILKLIEKRFGLPPFGSRDAAAKDMSNAFTFSPSRPSGTRLPLLRVMRCNS